MDKKKIINTSIEVNFQDFQPVSNTGFVRGVCKVAYAGENRNYTNIPKEAFEKAESTVFGIPVVGNWLGDNYGGHDILLETKGNDVVVKDNTIPYGFVPQDANPRWESVEDDNGNTKNYYVVDVILWQERYKEEVQFIIDNGTNQSMEIYVNDGDWDDNWEYFDINDFYYSALCLLGRDIDENGNKGSQDIEPCFEDAEVTVGQFTMSDKFKKDLFAIKSAFEGGEELSKEKEHHEEEIEETVENEEEIFEEEEVEVEEDKEEHSTETETDDETQEEIDSNDSSEDEFNYEAEFKAVSDKYDELAVEYKALEVKYNDLLAENEELQRYKNEKETEILSAQKDEIIDDYSLILSTEDIVEITEKKDEFSLDELKIELAKVFAEREVEKAKATKGKKDDDAIVFESKHKSVKKNKFAI